MSETIDRTAVEKLIRRWKRRATALGYAACREDADPEYRVARRCEQKAWLEAIAETEKKLLGKQE